MYDRELETLLAEGLGERGAQGGRVGGRLGSGLAGTGTGDLGGAAGASGGRTGARFAARWLRTRHHEERLELAVQPQLVWDVLEHLGRAVRSEDGLVRGVIGAGALNMNPAVVDVVIERDGATVRAAAKEGLIPQGTARKAVRRVVTSLEGRRGVFPATGERNPSYRAAPPS